MNKFWLILLCLPMVAMAEMYRWVDDKGNVHFSDKPIGDKSESYKPPPVPVVPAGPTADFSSRDETEEKKPFKYKSISLTSPSPDQVFFSDSNSINLSTSIDPGLDESSKHSVVIFLDGSEVSKGTALSHSISNLSRGSHTASAAVIDDKGKTIIKSDSVTFHIKRHHL